MDLQAAHSRRPGKGFSSAGRWTSRIEMTGVRGFTSDPHRVAKRGVVKSCERRIARAGKIAVILVRLQTAGFQRRLRVEEGSRLKVRLDIMGFLRSRHHRDGGQKHEQRERKSYERRRFGGASHEPPVAARSGFAESPIQNELGRAGRLLVGRAIGQTGRRQLDAGKRARERSLARQRSNVRRGEVICHGRAAQTNLLQTALKPLATQCALRFYQKSSVNNRRKSAEANPSLTSLSSPRQTQHAIFFSHASRLPSICKIQRKNQAA